MVERQQRDRGQCQPAQRGRAAQAQDRRRDRKRRQQQEGERVFQPAGQIEQCRQLDDIEGQQRGRGAFAQPLMGRTRDGEPEVEQHRGAEDGKPRAQHHRKPEPVMDHQQGRRLAADRAPADRDQRAQPDTAGRGQRARIGLNDVYEHVLAPPSLRPERAAEPGTGVFSRPAHRYSDPPHARRPSPVVPLGGGDPDHYTGRSTDRCASC